MKKIIYLFLSLAFFTLIFNPPAASAITVRIDQPKIRLTIPAGESKGGVINVENPSSQTIMVRVYLEDWLYRSAADGSKDFFPPATTALSCANWITFAPAEFTIPPYGRGTVNYTVSCPSGAQGGHYAVLFFETSLGKTQDEQGVNVLVVGRLGALFCIEPADTIRRQAELTNLTIVGSFGNQAIQDLDIKLDFVNTGNIDIAPEGTFYIMDKKGLIVTRGEFSKYYTLPGDKTAISSTISQKSASQMSEGEYDLIVTIDLGGIPEVLEARLKIDPSGKASAFTMD